MELKTLHEIFRSHPEGKWILGLEDAQRLYNLVKKLKPKKVLDLGTGIGCSASIIALALKDSGAVANGDLMKDYVAEIDSVEQFHKCWNIAKEIIPLDLQEYMSLSVCKPMIIEHQGIPHQKFSIFSELPMDDYDLVVIDGPGPWVSKHDGIETLIKQPNGDIILLLPRLKEGALIYLDERKDCEQLLMRYYREYLTVLNNTKDYTLFMRSDVPFTGVKSDRFREDMRLADYNYLEF